MFVEMVVCYIGELMKMQMFVNSVIKLGTRAQEGVNNDVNHTVSCFICLYASKTTAEHMT